MVNISGQIPEMVDSIMVKLRKPSKPNMGIFYVRSHTGEIKLQAIGVTSKLFERHFNDFPRYLIGVYNCNISPKALADDVNFVLKGL